MEKPKEKLRLEELKVESFVTSNPEDQLKGGSFFCFSTVPVVCAVGTVIVLTGVLTQTPNSDPPQQPSQNTWCPQPSGVPTEGSDPNCCPTDIRNGCAEATIYGYNC